MAVPYTARLATRAARKPELAPIDYDTDSLLKKVGRRTLGGLAMVGNFLDLPGSSIRDTLAGKNPFDQWLTPFTDDNRVGGRDLLEQYGVLGKNKKGFDWGDVAGFVGEVALDPLTYLTLGGSALGKGGQIAKRAGVLTDALRATGKGPRLGRMTTKFADVVKGADSTQLGALTDAAQKMGFSDLAEAVGKHGDDALGGLVGVGLPFKSPSFTLGKAGGKAEKVARGLDKVGSTIRYGKVPGTQFSPGQQVARVFSPKAMGLQSPDVAKANAGLHAAREAIHLGVRKETARDAVRLMTMGMLDDEASMLGRMNAEKVLDIGALPAEAQQKAKVVSEILEPYGEQMAGELHTAKTLGVKVEAHGDPAGIAYWPREFIDYVKNRAHTMPREDYLRGIKEGTEQLRQIISDPKVLDGTADDAYQYILREYGDKIITPVTRGTKESVEKASALGAREVPSGAGSNALQEAAQRKRMVGDVMDRMRKEGAEVGEEELVELARREVARKWRPKSTGGGSTRSGARTTLTYDLPVSRTAEHAVDVANRENLIRTLAHRIRNVYTKEQRAVGGYGQNVLLDAQDALVGMKWKNARAGAVLQTIKQLAKPLREIDAVGDTRSVAEVLEQVGLDATTSVKGTVTKIGGKAVRTGKEVETGALHKLAEAFDVAPTPENLADISRMHLPVHAADDVVRLMKGDDIKTVTGTLLDIFDSATNVFKVGVLNWPARYSRDFTSGQAMNMLTGNWGAREFSEAQKLFSGGVADFTDIPVISRMLAEQGLEATAENSTDMMRQLAYATEVFTGQHGAQGAGEVVGGLAMPGRSADFAAEFIGKDPLTPLKPQTIKGGSSWKPWKLRGVGGQLRTENYIAATGERLGRYTDGMNRVVPFIKNLRRGVAPEEAKRIVDGLQVNYTPRAYTAAEKKYLKRVFPFYSFSSRMLGHVFSQLAQHPGSGIAQSIRASNAMRGDEPVPEYVAQGMSVPLGELTGGHQRYLSGLSLMHEEPLSLLSARDGVPDVTDTLAELVGRMNPLAGKLPLELAAGESFFQRGPLGGRELTDMDPTIGRTLTNVGLRDELPTGRAKPFISTNVENVLANTPAARLLSTVRTATDPRKRESAFGLFPGDALASQLLTGVRISDVSPGAQDAVLRDELFAMMRQQGARAFESVRYSKTDIETAEKTNPDLAEQMKRFNAAAAALTKRAKSRSKKRKAELAAD